MTEDSTKIRAELADQLDRAWLLARTDPERGHAEFARLMPQYLDAVMVEAGDHPEDWADLHDVPEFSALLDEEDDV